MNIKFINNQKALEEFCYTISTKSIISVDSEFERRSSFFAKLSIIQIAAEKDIAIIDVLSGIDLTLIQEVFTNDKILKIFHSPDQDFQIFYQRFRCLPVNVFETQSAANICGFGKSLSYMELCKQICNVTLDKTHQRADWMQRPLSKMMLEYAALDVFYLEQIYRFLQCVIKEKNLQQVYNNRIKILLNPANYAVNFDNAWQKVKFQSRDEIFINRMKILAAFREEYASKLDIPRKYFASDEDLVKLCLELPCSEAHLNKLDISSKYLTMKVKYRNRLFEICTGLIYL